MKELLIIFTPSVAANYYKNEFALLPEKQMPLESLVNGIKTKYFIANDLNKNVCVYTDSQIQLKGIGEHRDLKKYLKLGMDEGEKMFNAFLKGFIKDYTHIVLLRNLSANINREIIKEAFEKLRVNDYVLGPENDGGYYLIGMKKLDPFLFDEHSSKKQILARDIIYYLQNQDYSFCTLPLLNEIQEAGMAKVVL